MDLNRHLTQGRHVDGHLHKKVAPHHTSSGRGMLKEQGDATTHLLEWWNLNNDNKKWWWACEIIGTLVLCWWEAKWYSHFGRPSGLFFKMLNLFFVLQSRYCISWYLCKEVENLCIHRNQHMHGFGCFIHNCKLGDNLQVLQ